MHIVLLFPSCLKETNLTLNQLTAYDWSALLGRTLCLSRRSIGRAQPAVWTPYINSTRRQQCFLIIRKPGIGSHSMLRKGVDGDRLISFFISHPHLINPQDTSQGLSWDELLRSASLTSRLVCCDKTRRGRTGLLYWRIPH
jgi:hypothetical protein